MPHATSIHSQHATCKCVAHCERQRDISSILTFDGNLYGTFYTPFVVSCSQWIYLQKKGEKKEYTYDGIGGKHMHSFYANMPPKHPRISRRKCIRHTADASPFAGWHFGCFVFAFQ